MTQPRASWGKSLVVSFEGAGFAIPLTVGAVALLFSRVGPALLLPGLVAALLGAALMQLATLRSGRPMVYSVRVLEVATLIGFLDHFIFKMPAWGLSDTPGHRLALMMCVSFCAALLLPVAYALRLQRFARMIPTPVFAGFNTALAVTLVISQAGVLWRSVGTDGAWFAAVAALVLGTAIATRRFRPQWPPGMLGLFVGTVMALLIAACGAHALTNVMQGGLVLTLPVVLVPWSDLAAPGVEWADMLRDIVLAGTTLAILIFLNTVVNEEAVTQIDGAQPRPRDWWAACLARLVAVVVGSPALTASVGPTRAAARVGALDWRAMLLVVGVTFAVLGSGILRLIPLAGICGLLLYDAWSGFDRPSAQMALQSLRGRRLVTSEKEDLVTIGMVVLASVLFNMVVGVFMGVFAGLILYAWRNGRRLARTVESGMTVRSNCARSRRDASLLAAHADAVRFVALEGALFFGAAAALQSLLRAQCAPGRYLVVDWARVVNADSTVASAFARAVTDAHALGSQVAISGIGAAGAQLADTLAAAGSQVAQFPDADRALEWAENSIIRDHSHTQTLEGTALNEALSLLQGVPSEAREALELMFEQRFFRSGDTVFQAGQHDSELMVILQGSVDILVPQGDDRDVRLARIRRGAMLGELSFLDASARAATAVATEDLLLGVLSRERFEAYAREWPDAARRVLANLALDLAFRLRRTNHMAVSSLR